MNMVHRLSYSNSFNGDITDIISPGLWQMI